MTIGDPAAQTTRIRFGTSVLVLPIRSPYAVAKQAATLHRLSGERVILGVGAGWDETEFAAVGASFGERGRRTDESLEIIRSLFAGEDRDGVFEPKLRAPLPIMIGGTTVRALRRAARFGAEWQGLGLDAAGFATTVSRLRALSAEAGNVRVGTRLDWSGGEPDPIVRSASAHRSRSRDLGGLLRRRARHIGSHDPLPQPVHGGLSLVRRTLPVALRGKSSRMTIWRGVL